MQRSLFSKEILSQLTQMEEEEEKRKQPRKQPKQNDAQQEMSNNAQDQVVTTSTYKRQ